MIMLAIVLSVSVLSVLAGYASYIAMCLDLKYKTDIFLNR